MDGLFEQMSQNSVFASLDENARRALSQMAISRKFVKGDCIAHHGDIWPYLLLITEGEVNALKESSEGRSLIVATFGAGEIFWGLAFFEETAPMPVVLSASAPTTIHLWPRERLLPTLMQNGSVSWELCRLMIRRMLHASEIVEELAFQPVNGRLARLLMDHFSSAGEQAITRSLTLDEMAARVGTTREMVCRALYRFADKKLIEVTRTEFVLTDKAGLKRVAGSQ
ncbi:MAG: Crp/Fnr family transcriptional regulator [Chloroflexi bacterium]|nr:Crp/Fnr family transcriptional regulator [Chloroflexota bacterium]